MRRSSLATAFVVVWIGTSFPVSADEVAPSPRESVAHEMDPAFTIGSGLTMVLPFGIL